MATERGAAAPRAVVMVPEVPNKDLVEWAFKRNDDGRFCCNNCKVDNIPPPGGGYCNLISHLSKKSCFGFTKLSKSANPAKYKKAMQVVWRAYHEAKAEERSNPIMNPAFTGFAPKISPDAKKIFGWIELIVFCNNSISIVENEIYRKYTKLEPTDRKTIRKYIVMLADIVGFRIKDAFGKGNCIADGWSEGGVHYIAVYHKWPMRNKDRAIENKKALLSIQPLLNESDLGAESIAESVGATYEIYTADDVDDTQVLKEAVVAYTLDNTSVNFEQGVVKIMNGDSESMTPEEQEACEPLLKENWPHLYDPEEEEALDLEVVDSPSKFAKMIAAGSKRAHSETVMRSKYIDCSFLCATTIVVERLFSKCGKVMTADRKSMMPRLFEAIVFLLENKDWWDINTVQEMMSGLWKDRLSVYDYSAADDAALDVGEW
jgi:hypothetical protein